MEFIAAAINELTVFGRGAYDQTDEIARLRSINEAVHRLAGHLRGLADPDEPMTLSRAEGVVEQLVLLPAGVVARMESYCPLEPARR